MNQAEKNRWLEPSPPIAIDSSDGTTRVHTARVRDLRVRFGDPETYVAECACGWISDPHTGRFAERAARREGRTHVELELASDRHHDGLESAGVKW